MARTTAYALRKGGTTRIAPHNFYSDIDGVVLLFRSEWEAEKVATERPRISGGDWLVTEADAEFFQCITDSSGSKARFGNNKVHRFYGEHDKEVKAVAKTKAVSSNLLVEVYEDPEQRKYAIASKANSEQEFIAEFAEALGSRATDNWTLRLKELLPLATDMVCKYRGYRADTVQERRELVAGDLAMPTA